MIFYILKTEILSKINLGFSLEDFYCWNHTRSGDYTVKSCYWFTGKDSNKEAYVAGAMLPSLNDIKDYIWSLETTVKINFFLWKAISRALLACG